MNTAEGTQVQEFTADDLALVDGGAGDGQVEGPKGEVDALSAAEIEAEIAQIQNRIRSDRAGYFKDETAQARYRQLLARRDQEAEPSGEGDDEQGLPAELLEEWEKNGGVAHNLKAAQNVANSMIDTLDDGERAQLLESFDELPVTAHAKVYAFLSIDPAPARPASDEAMETFGSTPEGASLLKEWGSRAAIHVATVKNRIETITSTLSDDDRAHVLHWFDNLSENQARAVLRGLAGKRR